jgi:hypothetical protein
MNKPTEDIPVYTEAGYSEAKIQFSEGDIRDFIELGKILKRIHTRLTMEGYVIRPGKIYKP